MNEKFNKNAKVEQLTKLFWSHEEEKGLIVKDPLAGVITDWLYNMHNVNGTQSIKIVYKDCFIIND